MSATVWLKMVNFAESTLDGAILAADLTLDVQAGDAAGYGAVDYHLVIGDTVQGFEIVKATGVAGDTITVTRAQEGTVALPFDDATPVRLNITALYATEIQDGVNNIEDGTTRLTSVTGDTDADLVIGADLDLILRCDLDGDGANKIAFHNGADVEVGNIDESGNLQLDGDLTIDGNNISDSGGVAITFDGAQKATFATDVDVIDSLTAGRITVGDAAESVANTIGQRYDIDNSAQNPWAAAPFLVVQNNDGTVGDHVPIRLGAGEGEFGIIDMEMDATNIGILSFWFRGDGALAGVQAMKLTKNAAGVTSMDVTGDTAVGGDLTVTGNTISNDTGAVIEMATGTLNTELAGTLVVKTQIAGDTTGDLTIQAGDATDTLFLEGGGGIRLDTDETTQWRDTDAGDAVVAELDHSTGDLQLDGDLTIDGNNISDSGGVAITFDGAGTATIAGNIISTAGDLSLKDPVTSNIEALDGLIINADEGGAGTGKTFVLALDDGPFITMENTNDTVTVEKDLVVDGVTVMPFAVGAKAGMSSIGGLCIKITNTTGAVTVAGQVVTTDTTTDDAVVLSGADEEEAIGVFLEAGIADDAEAWVVVSGIADVAMEDGTAATHGNWVRTSVGEAGYADSTNASPPGGGIANLDIHMREIGNCIETVAGGGGGTHILARCVLHFN